MKKLFITIIAILLPMVANADPVEIDCIWYNLVSEAKIAEVTTPLSDKYFGEIKIPEKVTFDGSEYIVTSIGKGAFSDCRDLTSVTIPNSVTSIGNSAFMGCNSLISVTIPEGVTSIGIFAFYGCCNLISVNIPEGVTYINHSAFRDCSRLTSVNIPASVTSIGDNAFYGCSGLTSVNIPASVTSIGDNAFSHCSGLTSVKIPDGLTFIGNGTFSLCSGLTSVFIPVSVTSIGENAFYDCSSLTSVIIPDGVISIGNCAFQRCRCLTSVNIPANVTSIGYRAFYDCNNLTSVFISDVAAWCNLKFHEITSNPLYYAHHLYIDGKETKNLSVPEGVTSIGSFAFSGCIGLKTIIIPESVTFIDYRAFYDCSGLTSVKIPASVTSIGEYTFSGCSSLTSIFLPDDLTIIKESTFYGCSSLESIRIPSKVEVIYQEAFANCTKLKKVIALSEEPPFLYDNSFSNYDITLSVPKDSKEKYRSTEPWNKFKYIETQSGEVLEKQKCSIPQIIYKDRKLSYCCDTEGVEFVSNITDVDIAQYYVNEINLTATYNISVYARKSGYEDSDLANATLCWIDYEPTMEGLSDRVANIRSMPVLIQNISDTLIISGVSEGETISVFDLNGRFVSSTKSLSGSTIVKTNLHRGDIGIVKIGDRAIKVQIR